MSVADDTIAVWSPSSLLSLCIRDSVMSGLFISTSYSIIYRSMMATDRQTSMSTSYYVGWS